MKNKKILFLTITFVIAFAIIIYITNPICSVCADKVLFSSYWLDNPDGSASRVCEFCYYDHESNKTIFSDISESEKAELLCKALSLNKTLSSSEKKELQKFSQYFLDNKYIDCDRVYNKLINFTVNKNDPSLLEQGIGAAYYADNSITFATQDDRDNSLSHEIHHAMENEVLDYGEYEWFVEGFTCLVNFEYFGNTFDGANSKTFFIRSLCEFIDADVLFQLSAGGDINVLISALENCGMKSEEIDQLFNMFKHLCVSESNTSMSSIEDRVALARFVIELYCSINNCNEISESLHASINAFLYQSADGYKYYCLNSSLKNISPDSLACIPIDQLDNLLK